MVHKEIAAHETHEGAPMKQNLRGKAFVAFVCLVGKRLLPKIVVGNHLQKKIFAKRDEFSL